MTIAVVLFNLGGPLHQESVKSFLWNLFKDPHIIRLPAILRYPLAWLISTLRTPKAQNIYQQLGGGSPLNANTQTQVEALERLLQSKGHTAKVFMCMRYAPPMTKSVVASVRAFNPNKIILVPLYPQFSTTTTLSSFNEWNKYTKDLSTKTKRLCCYATQNTFVEAHRNLIEQHLKVITKPVKLLFSAHSIPLDLVASGDPYAFQVEATVKTIMACESLKNYPYQICYQSRVGPKKWLEPIVDSSLKECLKDNRGAVVIPISFVSDHSETLVELDIQYKEKAKAMGLIHYSRVPALGHHPLFIQALAEGVETMLSDGGFQRVCPLSLNACYSSHHA